MDPSGCLGLLVVILLLTLVIGDGGADTLPRFVSPIENVTVSVGRDARLSCVVENLHNYQVAWIYKGTGGRTVLTVATQVITKNPRVSSTQEAQAWVLTITSLTKKDQGIYMCQVNTKPVRKQMGYLHVVVPPVIDDVSSSSDVTVDEGSDVVMTCEARGDPHPVIRWVREDGRRFNLNFSSTVEEQVGRSLKLWSVSHNTSGAFLCIATNGVPPSVSKRILLTVNSAPRIVQEGESGRVGAPAEGVATLICSFHARPLAEVRWDRGPRQVKVHGPGVTIDTTSDQETGLWRSVLTVHMKKASDFGQYRCLVRNRLGTDQVFFHVTAVETTTSVSQKRFIQDKGESVGVDPKDQQRQTPLSFGSYFDYPTSSASLIWSSSSLWLVTCLTLFVILAAAVTS
ncbi:limbic system-associated membrane protein-like isoform X2 [Cherax quadricarinatus]|uniref:limbic system-associated membrane protein-like isoform X2 n=1 Tax=Cherax quadricarinatus TaxID=27406 RepID=UPI00387E5C2D